MSVSDFFLASAPQQLDPRASNLIAAASYGMGNLDSSGVSALWVHNTAYVPGNLVVNGSNVYTCTVGGTSASSGGPTGTGTAIVDGTVHWNYVQAWGGAANISPNGSGGLLFNTIADSDPAFDLRGYDEVTLVAQGTFAAAVQATLYLNPVWKGHLDPTLADDTGTNIQGPASGCTMLILAGQGVPVSTATTFGSQSDSGVYTTSPILPPFARARLAFTAAPGLVTGGQVILLGKRTR